MRDTSKILEKTVKHLFAILGLLALAAPLRAAPTASATVYDIEVLVFENNQPGLEGPAHPAAAAGL